MKPQVVVSAYENTLIFEDKQLKQKKEIPVSKVPSTILRKLDISLSPKVLASSRAFTFVDDEDLIYWYKKQ